MPVLLLRIAASSLILVFGWAALAKLLRWSAWKKAVTAYRLPQAIATGALLLTPIAEAVVAGSILAGATLASSAASLVLLALFSVVLVRARAQQGDRLPCGCFGGTTTRDYRWLLARNAGLATLAATVLVGGRDVAIAEGLQAPAFAPAVLIIAGAAVLAWMIAATTPTLRHRGPRA